MAQSQKQFNEFFAESEDFKEEEVFEFVKNYVEAGGDINAEVRYDGDYNSLLVFSIHKGYYELAKYLVEKGAKVNCSNYTASPLCELLMTASETKNSDEKIIELVALMLEKGADPNEVHGEYKFPFTPLYWAAQCPQYMELTNLLFQYGGTKNILKACQEMPDSQTPMDVAYELRRFDLVKLLAEHLE